ncbi:MAG: NAD(+)/NADH kinase [Planctomycetota bacterium]|nr:MAG: NAD(+)/NADH kinase [Planctomycetota bacterium]
MFFLANPDKPEAAQAMRDLVSFVRGRCDVAGAREGRDAGEAVALGADRVVVLGGDGTLIGAVRSLQGEPIPLVGVNVGKLGFLTEFSMEEFRRSFDRIVTDETLVHRRTMLRVRVQSNGVKRDPVIAVNDCVIQAGPPFRIIRLDIGINGEPLTELAGDGVIVCTPSGSTAHNLSAGGPIMQAGVDAIALTPLAPHSLTHKPLVIERDAVIDVRAAQVNPGTTVIIDGQISFPLEPDDCVTVTRSDRDFLLVRNPACSQWHNLIGKLQWGRRPPVAES